MKKASRSLRRWLLWAAGAGFVWYLVTRIGDIESLLRTVSQGAWPWILVAVASQAADYVLFALLFQGSFVAVGVRGSLGQMLPLTLGAVFVNTLAPSGGTAGLALYVDDAIRRGESPSRATAGTLLASVMEFAAFTLVLAGGLAELYLSHDLRSYEILATVALMLFTGGQAAAIVLGAIRRQWLEQLLGQIQAVVRRLFRLVHRPCPLTDDWARRSAEGFASAGAAIRARPTYLARPALVALASQLVNLASLYCLFRAFGVSIRLGPLVAGYAMGDLFLNASPVPQGIGVVEGVMTLVFTSLGQSAAAALAVTIAFRGLSFWIPFVLGFLCLRRLKSFAPPNRHEDHRPGLR